MPLTLVVGIDSIGRRDTLLDLVRARPTERAIVARTQLIAHEIGRAAATLPSTDWVPAYSWRQWAESLWLGLGDGRTPVDDAARELVISELLGERDALGEYREPDVLDLLGGRNLLARLVSSYPASTLAQADSGGGHDSLLASARRYYLNLTERGYVELPDLLDALSAGMPQKLGTIGVTGFLTLAEYERRFISKLSSSGADVIVEIPFAAGSVSTRVNSRLVELLVSEGASVVDVQADPVRPGIRLASTIEASASPGYARTSVVAGDSATFWVGEGVDAEVSLAVDAIQYELSIGTEPANIVVIVRQLNRNIHRLVGELERRNISYAVSGSVSMASTGLGAAIIQMCDIADALRVSGSASGAPILGPLLGSAYSGVGSQRASELDARIRRKRQSLLSSARDIAYSKRGEPGFGPRSAIGRLLEIAESPADDDGLARKWKIASDEALRGALGSLQTSWWSEAQDLSAHAAFSDILATMADGGVSITPAHLRSQVRQATVVVSPPPNASGHVLVTSPGGVVGRQLKALVISGLTAGESGDGVSATPAERRVASQVGVDGPIDATGERVLRDIGVLTTASERVHLIWRALDGVSGAVEPSALLEEVLLGMGVRPRSLHEAMRKIAELGVEPTAITETEERLVVAQLTLAVGLPEAEAQSAVGLAKRGKYRGLGDRDIATVRIGAHPERAAEYSRPQTFAPQYDLRGQARICYPDGYWQDRATTPRAIEAYARCPYDWFLSHLVHMTSLDDDYSAASSGSMIHSILERFYVRWTRIERRGAIRPDDLPRARVLFDELKAEAVRAATDDMAQSAPSPELDELVVGLDAELAWNVILDDAHGRLYYEDDLPFEPRLFEWRFGEGAEHRGADPAEERELDAFGSPVVVGGIPIAGIVDRIDVLSNPNGTKPSIAVLDYKNGTDIVTKSMPEVTVRNTLQVPIYLIAASRALEMSPAVGAYVGYRKRLTSVLATKEVLPSRNARDDDAFHGELLAVEDLVRDVGAQMRAGHIRPLVDAERAKNANCRFCANWWCAHRPKGEW